MLRRAAMERRLANFPPQVALPPIVESGALMIVGGGALPTEVVQRFIELAGGYEAPMVVLPIAAEETLPEDESRDTRVLTLQAAKKCEVTAGPLARRSGIACLCRGTAQGQGRLVQRRTPMAIRRCLHGNDG